jgi:hypothetical protein
LYTLNHVHITGEPKTVEATSKTRQEHNNKEEDFLFFTGAGLLIVYFILASPITPNFRYSTTIFWMATTILILAIAPDYLNNQTIKQWTTKHKGSKTQSFYAKIYHITQAISRHINPSNILYVALLLALTAIAILLFTGNVAEICFGASCGLLIKATLTHPTKNPKR